MTVVISYYGMHELISGIDLVRVDLVRVDLVRVDFESVDLER